MTTILVVDDSEMDCRIAGGLLEKEHDCQVVYATDGATALKSVDETCRTLS